MTRSSNASGQQQPISARGEVEILTTEGALESLRPSWSAQVSRCAGNLYTTYEWVTSLWESHHRKSGV